MKTGSKQSISIQQGDTVDFRNMFKITATYSNGDKDVTGMVGLSFQETNVASVSNWQITGLNVGTATLNVGYGKEITVKVEVKERPLTENDKRVLQIKKLIKEIIINRMAKLNYTSINAYDIKSPDKDSLYYEYLRYIFGKQTDGYGIEYINEYSEDEYILNVLERINNGEIIRYSPQYTKEGYLMEGGEYLDSEVARAYELVNTYRLYLTQQYTFSHSLVTGVPIYSQEKINEMYKGEFLQIEYWMIQNTVFQNADYTTVVEPILKSIRTGTPIDLKKLDSIVDTIRKNDTTVDSYFSEKESKQQLATISFIVGFIPLAEIVKGVGEFTTGEEFLTGEKLNWVEKSLGLVCLVDLIQFGKSGFISKVSDKADESYKLKNLSKLKSFTDEVSTFADNAVKKLDEIAEVCKKGACFTGETLIATEQGLRRIDEIKVGDYVWAVNIETGEKALKQVTNFFENETSELIHITVNGEQLNTTAEHPFYVENQDWTLAKDLKPGDMLSQLNGAITPIAGIDVEAVDESTKVYNFTVENFSNYYVGNSKVLVHNASSTGICNLTKQLQNATVVGNTSKYVPTTGNWKATGMSQGEFLSKYEFHLENRKVKSGNIYYYDLVNKEGVIVGRLDANDIIEEVKGIKKTVPNHVHLGENNLNIHFWFNDK